MEPNLNKDTIISQAQTGAVLGQYYSIGAIFWTSLFFGPFAGSYMVYKNFLLLGKKGSANTTRNVTIIISIIFALFILFPMFSFTSKNFIGPAFTLAISALASNYQKDLLQGYATSGGKKTSFWANLVVGFVSMIALIVYIFLFVFIQIQIQ